jgi:hypothetical protein
LEFVKWPSIPRLSKERMLITEKLDGTNACIVIELADSMDDSGEWITPACSVTLGSDLYYLWAQSRSRFITPEDDNFGFAKWVHKNAEALINTLGVGKHFGEWWGSGIQRGYGLSEKRFSLFNAPRWSETISYLFPHKDVPELRTVPILYQGPVDWSKPDEWREKLSRGSVASPTFAKAEGMVLYLREANTSYKILLENDDIHKWEQK